MNNIGLRLMAAAGASGYFVALLKYVPMIWEDDWAGAIIVAFALVICALRMTRVAAEGRWS